MPLPEPRAFNNDASDILAMADRCQVPTLGRIHPQQLIWPVNRRQARKREDVLAQADHYQAALNSL